MKQLGYDGLEEAYPPIDAEKIEEVRNRTGVEMMEAKQKLKAEQLETAIQFLEVFGDGADPADYRAAVTEILWELAKGTRL